MKVLLVGPPLDELGGVSAYARWFLANQRDSEYLNYWGRWRVGPPVFRAASSTLGARQLVRAAISQGEFDVIYILGGTRAAPRDVLLMQAIGKTQTPVLWHIHAGGLQQSVTTRSARTTFALGCKLASAVAVTSAADRGFLKAAFGCAATVVPNPVNDEFLTKAVPPPLDTTPTLKVLVPGWVDSNKRLSAVVAAARDLRSEGIDISVRAIGPIKTGGKAQLVASTQLLGDAFTYVGSVDLERMPEAFDQSDVVALFSRTEGLPMVLLEGMARGRPFVATAVGGITALAEQSGGGITVGNDDVIALRSALGELARDQSLRNAMGTRGSEYVRTHHSGQAIRVRIQAILSSIAAQDLP